MFFVVAFNELMQPFIISSQIISCKVSKIIISKKYRVIKIILANKKDIILIMTYYNKDITFILDKNFINDKQIASLSIKKDFNNFFHLSEKLKKDIQLWKIVLESMVRQGVWIEQATNFIDKFFPDFEINKILKNHYLKKLKFANKIYNDDLSKWVLLIMDDKTEFYELLLNKKVLNISSKNIKLDKNFISGFLDFISKNKDLELLEGEKFNKKKREILLKFLGVSEVNLSSDDLFVFNTIFNLLNVWENIKKWFTEKEDKQEKNKLKIKLEKKEKENLKISPEEKLDFCVGSYEYKEISSWYYSIITSNNKEIKISKQELDNFTTVWLKNFIKFYEILQELDLNFLWDNTKSSFINILNNKIGFNYPDWEWVTQSRALRVLNLLWNAIGLIWDDKNSDYKKNFDTLEGAKLAFNKIKSTWKIWENTYEVASMISDTPVKKALKYKWYMSEKNELNFSKF